MMWKFKRQNYTYRKFYFDSQAQLIINCVINKELCLDIKHFDRWDIVVGTSRFAIIPRNDCASQA